MAEHLQRQPSEGQKVLQHWLEKDASAYRSPTGLFRWLVAMLGAGMVLFYFYAAAFTPVTSHYHRGVYVFVTYILVFLLFPAGRNPVRVALSLIIGGILSCTIIGLVFFESSEAFHAALTTGSSGMLAGVLLGGAGIGIGATFIDSALLRKWPSNPTLSDLLYAVASAVAVYYWIHEFEAVDVRPVAETSLDAMISIMGVILSFEVCRRVLGWPITLIGLCLIFYAYFGPFFPGIMAHRGFGIEELCTALYLTSDGVYGIMANVLATYVILFIFFGAFLHKSGAGKFFIDFPLALVGRSTGGPAKVAVLASALFGSVSGSAIANTVSTGSFTIPLMKRAGFQPQVAGGIEPAASIGGMLLPPVMGAGGFMMAELTGNSYASIMMIALFPALLYFFSVFCMIHFEAKKLGLGGIDDENLPHWQDVLKKEWYYTLPLVIITVLIVVGKDPRLAAFWATLSCIGISWVRKETRMGIKETWEAILTGANNTLVIGAMLGVIGIIVGTISLTGIGPKFAALTMSLAGGNLLSALALVAIASLMLGMGVPVTAAYLITAVLAVPPLAEMGVPILCAHMIIYWFSQDSNLTPPVGVAAYAGAAIAGSNPWQTAWHSFKFAKLLYVCPLLFAFTPAILLQPHTVSVRVPDFGTDRTFAKVMSIDVQEGQYFHKGDIVARLMPENQVIGIQASGNGQVRKIRARAGAMVNSGATLLETAQPATGIQIASSFFSATLGTIAFSATTMFFWFRRTTLLEWLLLAAGTCFLYWPTLWSDVIGIVLVGLVIVMQITKNKREQSAMIAPAG